MNELKMFLIRILCIYFSISGLFYMSILDVGLISFIDYISLLYFNNKYEFMTRIYYLQLIFFLFSFFISTLISKKVLETTIKL